MTDILDALAQAKMDDDKKDLPEGKLDTSKEFAQKIVDHAQKEDLVIFVTALIDEVESWSGKRIFKIDTNSEHVIQYMGIDYESSYWTDVRGETE